MLVSASFHQGIADLRVDIADEVQVDTRCFFKPFEIDDQCPPSRGVVVSNFGQGKTTSIEELAHVIEVEVI